MQQSMIYGEALPFNEIIKKLKEFQKYINSLRWN